MSEIDHELSQLLDEAVARLSTYRRTFTDEEALAPIWQRHYDLSPQSDPQARFVLAYEADGKHRRQWRLHTQALANNRLLDALISGAWNGQNLEAELARLDAEDHTWYIFCPCDSRFTIHPDGTLEPADRERNVVLVPATRAALDALGPALLEQWHAGHSGPLTVLQVTERLGILGWPEATTRDGWLLVRAWLLEWSEVTRVGQDYWIDQLPQGPERTRLQVLPVAASVEPHTETITSNTPASSERASIATIDKSQVIPARAVIAHQVSWTCPLRTVHLLEGFLPVPSTARSAYPPRGISEGDREVLRGLWYDSDERIWLWLDRTQDRLYGPDLTHKLEWLDAGDLLRIEWRPEVVALRIVGHDDEVQREETRLVDPAALKALRGGLGETYRQSLQAILSDTPEGLTFAQVVAALRERQRHEVLRKTVRALLYTGGFVQRQGRWFAAPHTDVGARKLRTALIETLVSAEGVEQPTQPITDIERLRTRVQAIKTRLSELVDMLSKNSY